MALEKGGGHADLALLIYHTDNLHEAVNRRSADNGGMRKVISSM
jgi:hypothetical protein